MDNGKEQFIAMVKSDAEAAAAVRDIVALFNGRFESFRGQPLAGLALHWPQEIQLFDKDGDIGVAKLRKRPAAKEAKCSVNGAKDAERVYEWNRPDGSRVQVFHLCLVHATEWAALKGDQQWR